MRLLQLQEQGWVLHLNQVVNVLKPSLHQLHLGLDSIVAVSDGCANYFFRTGEELARKQLNELILDVLDEIKLGHALVVHDKDGQEAVRVLDAGVGHLYEDVCVLLEVNHELLLLLHVSEFVFIHAMSVVKEQVVLACQFHLDLMDCVIIISIQKKHFDSNRLECTNFLWSLTRVLNPQLKWRLSIKHDHVSLGYTNSKVRTEFYDTLSNLPSDGSRSSIAVKSKLLSTDTA